MKPVTKENPCLHCGKPDWCMATEDGQAILCNRGDRYSPPDGYIYIKDSSDGSPIFVLDEKKEKFTSNRIIKPIRTKQMESSTNATATTTSSVATATLNKPSEISEQINSNQAEDFKLTRLEGEYKPPKQEWKRRKDGGFNRITTLPYSETQQVIRTDFYDSDKTNRVEIDGKNKKCSFCSVDPLDKVQWVYKKGALPWPAYGLDAAIKASIKGFLLTVEGESCADEAHRLGLQAITWAGNGWNKDDIVRALSPIKKAGYIGIAHAADNDAPGRKKAQLVIECAREIGLIAVIIDPKKIREDAPEKWDIADWIRENNNNIDPFTQNIMDKQYFIDKLEECLKLEYELNKIQEEQQQNAPSASSTPNSQQKAAQAKSTQYDDLEKEEIRQEVENQAKRYESFDIYRILPTKLANQLLKHSRPFAQPSVILATILLTVASSLLGTQTKVIINRGSKFIQPAVLWTSLVGASDSAKSPLIRLISEPLVKMQGEAYQRYEEEKKEYLREVAEYEKKRKESKDNSLESPEPPAYRMFSFQDFTIEALAHYLAPFPEKGSIVVNDELAGFFKSLNQYKSGGGNERQKWLEMYNGDGLNVVRVKNEPVHLSNTAIQILGGIQPSTLLKEMGDLEEVDGLWSRFLYLNMADNPMPSPSWEEEEDTLSEDLLDLYKRLDNQEQKIYALEIAARPVWDKWHEFTEKKAMEAKHPALQALYRKARARAPRIALVIHCLNAAYSGEVPDELITAETLEAAIDLTKYSLAQIEGIYGDFGVGVTPVSPKIAKFLAKFEDTTDWISVREITRSRVAGTQKAAEAKKFMAELVTLGYCESNGEDKIKLLKKCDNCDNPPETLAIQRSEPVTTHCDNPVTGVTKSVTTPCDTPILVNDVPVTDTIEDPWDTIETEPVTTHPTIPDNTVTTSVTPTINHCDMGGESDSDSLSQHLSQTVTSTVTPSNIDRETDSEDLSHCHRNPEGKSVPKDHVTGIDIESIQRQKQLKPSSSNKTVPRFAKGDRVSINVSGNDFGKGTIQSHTVKGGKEGIVEYQVLRDNTNKPWPYSESELTLIE